MGNIPSISNGTWTETKEELCWLPEGEDESEKVCGEIDKCSAGIGIILPLFFEGTWPREARATLYLVGLLYSFLGVQIIADVFMCSIEKITSKTKRIHIAGGKEDEPEVRGHEIASCAPFTIPSLVLLSVEPQLRQKFSSKFL